MNKMTLALWLAIAALTVFIIIDREKENKTAYIDKGYVYEGFEMKKELQKKLETMVNAREAILDSLMTNLTKLKKKIEVDDFQDKEDLIEFDVLREKYLEKEKQFAEDNNAVSIDYNGQVWKQLNQYVTDYGKENDYEYIFGAGGDGNLMHASPKQNLTEKILSYVNSRYSGNGK